MLKRLFEPGQGVEASNGDRGIVVSPEELVRARQLLREKRRPGSFFAQGCCPVPDYILKVPVVFLDRTFDIMRASSIKRCELGAEEIKELRDTFSSGKS